MPSADLYLIINKVDPVDVIGFHCVRSFQSMTLKSQGTYNPEPDLLVTDRPLVKQISPDKNMNFLCTVASFTVAVRTHGFVVLCQLTFSLRLNDVLVHQLTNLRPASSRPSLAIR
jgi:hypothetical protein